MEAKVILIGSGTCPKSLLEAMESNKDNIIIVSNARDMIGMPDMPLMITRKEPFIITVPPIYDRTFDDYADGKSRRRARRLKSRKK